MSSSWLHALAFRIDQWGNGARAEHARRTAQKPGYGVLELPDGRMRYRMHGAGPAVAFMADPPVSLEFYDELVAALSGDHTVIVLEPLGFGFSTFAPHVSSFPFERALETTRRALVELDRGPYLLAFPCVSAYSALALARRWPELVSALILAQAPAWAEIVRWKTERDPLGLLSTPVLGQVALHLAKRPRCREWFVLASGSRARRKEFIAAADRAFADGAAFSLASAFQALPGARFVLPPVLTRTLFIWGLKDRSHLRTQRRSSLEHAPRGCLLEAPELGHFPELEDPPRFARVLRAFERGESPATASDP